MPITTQLPEEILETVAKAHGLPVHVVDRIVRHQFGYVKQQMKLSNSVRLHKLGVFARKELFRNGEFGAEDDSGLLQGGSGEG